MFSFLANTQSKHFGYEIRTRVIHFKAFGVSVRFLLGHAGRKKRTKLANKIDNFVRIDRFKKD